MHTADVAASGRAQLVFWNAEQADASVRRVAESGALIIPGHDRPIRMRGGEIHYDGDEEITLLNAGPGRAGQTLVPYPPPPEQWVMPGIEEQRLPDGFR